MFSFTNDLIDALSKRLNPVLHEEHLQVLEVFDASELVRLHCGKRDATENILYNKAEGEIESYGVKEVEALLYVASKIKHVKEYGINFNHRMG